MADRRFTGLLKMAYAQLDRARRFAVMGPAVYQVAGSIGGFLRTAGMKREWETLWRMSRDMEKVGAGASPADIARWVATIKGVQAACCAQGIKRLRSVY